MNINSRGITLNYRKDGDDFSGNQARATAKRFSLLKNFNDAENDYLYMDSITLEDKDRPQLTQVLMNPRDILATILLAFGVAISVGNLLGTYSKDVHVPLQLSSLFLGFRSGIASLLQVITGYKVSYLNRRGLVDDPNVKIYAGIYSLSVSWLGLRACEIYPSWLISFDTIFPWFATIIFVLAAVTPAVTL